MKIEGRVGDGFQYADDGSESSRIRLGRTGETIVTGSHGTYYEQCSRGNVFIGSTVVAGKAIVTSGSGVSTLFNPLGSNVNLSVIRLILSATMTLTNSFTGIVWAYTINAGNQQQTTGTIRTFTRVAPVCALVGSGTVPKGQWAPATTTWNANPVTFGGVGIAETAMTAAGVENPFKLSVDYDGSLVVLPGDAISLCSTAATTTTLYNLSVIWEEVPI